MQTLRYGENPHQRAAFYRDAGKQGPSIGTAVQRSGKELSFNNILDTNAALELVKEFEAPACAIIKQQPVWVCARRISLLPSRVPLPATRSPRSEGSSRATASWMPPRRR